MILRRRLHVDGLEARFLLIFDGADIDADGAAGAIFGRDLDAVLEAGEFLVAGFGRLEGRWRAFELGGVEDLDADDGVRTDHGAFAALDADFRVPDGNFQSEVALFPLGCAGGEGAVNGEGADGEFVAAILIDDAENVAIECGGGGGEGLGDF